MRISIVGLGKLGAPMAAVMAHKGHTVVGVDLAAERVEAVNQGRAPVEEPGLAEMIRENHSRLRATTDCEAAIAASEVTFLIVPTPSEPHGGFSLRHVLNAARALGPALARKQEFHLVVLSSTVMPGSMGGEVLPALEKASGKRCGIEFGLCYNPEFIALGSVIHDLLHPDMILIGESDPRSGGILADFYAGLCESNPRINRMNFVNAELTKLAVNTYLTTKISYANALAEVCEKLPGADAAVVAGAVGCDTRIGGKYLRGALGYGGPCFPRDNKAFVALARAVGVPSPLAEATDQVNQRQARRVSELVRAKVPAGGTVGILGLAYKPDTGVVEESQGLAIARDLLSSGIRVVVYDPAAMEEARRELSGELRLAHSLEECLAEADVVAVTTPWREFRRMTPALLGGLGKRLILFDCWGMLDHAALEPFAECLVIGLGPGR